jgi:Zn-dependent protease with chaperone function
MKPGLNISILLIICFSFSTRILAQNATSYSPLEDDPKLASQLTIATEKRYKQDLTALNGNLNKKYFEEVYKERYQKIQKMYSEQEIIAEGKAAGYLQSLVNEIIKSNPSLGNLETRIVFSRAWWPNASSMGEGTIIFNIGLFNRLANESQAAFVLCHELAHLYLDHSNKSIARYVNTVYSDEFQKELKRIQKTEYQKRQHAETLVKNLAFRNRRHSREHETEADSLALEWMKNTAFDVRESISCLSLLDSVDRDKYDINPELEQVFHSKDYPFQAQWVKKEEGMFSAMAASTEDEAKRERDSLKTHPDCSNRIKRISARVDQYYKGNSRTFVISEEQFERLQNDFDYEIIEHCYRSQNISRSLYYSLQMLPVRRADAYLITNIGRCLNAIYTAQKAHTLGKIVDLPSPYNDKKYDKLLRFIQQLRLPDIAAISYFYLLIYQTELATHENFLEALINSKANYNKPEEKKYWVDRYNKQFPNGKFQF